MLLRLLLIILYIAESENQRLEEAAMPLILTFPPLSPLPLTKGGDFLFCRGNLLHVSDLTSNCNDIRHNGILRKVN